MLCAILGLDSAGYQKRLLPFNGRSYLLTGRGYHNQFGRIDSEAREAQRSGFFLMVSGLEAICLLVGAA